VSVGEELKNKIDGELFLTGLTVAYLIIWLNQENRRAYQAQSDEETEKKEK
jgi:hypothetical protein